jgi:hypothetical protein
LADLLGEQPASLFLSFCLIRGWLIYHYRFPHLDNFDLELRRFSFGRALEQLRKSATRGKETDFLREKAKFRFQLTGCCGWTPRAHSQLYRPGC